MTRLRSMLLSCGLCVALLAMPGAVRALTEFSEGDAPLSADMVPLGATNVVNSPGRVAFWQGSWTPVVNYAFQCKDTAQFNAALTAFAAIQAPMTMWRPSTNGRDGAFAVEAANRLTLVVHDGPEYLPGFILAAVTNKADRVLDWRFSVSSPINWYANHYNPTRCLFQEPLPPPRIDVYIGGGGRIAWKDVIVPANVRVIDQRAEAAPVKPVGGGLVRGTIYSMVTGLPIPDAEIMLVDLGRHVGPEGSEPVPRGKTDARGFAELTTLPAGRYSIVVRADTFAARCAEQAYENRKNTYHEFALALLPTNSVKGCVTDAQGQPLAGIPVAADETLAIDGRPYLHPEVRTVKTDAKGCFELGGLPWHGFTQVRCEAPPLYQTPSCVEIYKIPSDGLTFVMTGTGIVRGKVVDPDGKAPAGRVCVQIQQPVRNLVGTWGGSMECRADGGFEFQGVPPGEYVVDTDLMSDGTTKDARRVTVKAGETVEVNVERR